MPIASKGVSRPSPRRKHASANRRKASPTPLQLPLSDEGREIVKLLNECRAADAAQCTFGSSNRDASRLQKRAKQAFHRKATAFIDRIMPVRSGGNQVDAVDRHGGQISADDFVTLALLSQSDYLSQDPSYGYRLRRGLASIALSASGVRTWRDGGLRIEEAA